MEFAFEFMRKLIFRLVQHSRIKSLVQGKSLFVNTTPVETCMGRLLYISFSNQLIRYICSVNRTDLTFILAFQSIYPQPNELEIANFSTKQRSITFHLLIKINKFPENRSSMRNYSNKFPFLSFLQTFFRCQEFEG